MSEVIMLWLIGDDQCALCCVLSKVLNPQSQCNDGSKRSSGCHHCIIYSRNVIYIRPHATDYSSALSSHGHQRAPEHPSLSPYARSMVGSEGMQSMVGSGGMQSMGCCVGAAVMYIVQALLSDTEPSMSPFNPQHARRPPAHSTGVICIA